MSKPTSNYSHLWDNLPIDERKRLYPFLIEAQILNLWQCKQTAIKAHKKHMKELDDWMNNLKDGLK